MGERRDGREGQDGWEEVQSRMARIRIERWSGRSIVVSEQVWIGRARQ